MSKSIPGMNLQVLISRYQWINIEWLLNTIHSLILKSRLIHYLLIFLWPEPAESYLESVIDLVCMNLNNCGIFLNFGHSECFYEVKEYFWFLSDSPCHVYCHWLPARIWILKNSKSHMCLIYPLISNSFDFISRKLMLQLKRGVFNVNTPTPLCWWG